MSTKRNEKRTIQGTNSELDKCDGGCEWKLPAEFKCLILSRRDDGVCKIARKQGKERCEYGWERVKADASSLALRSAG